MSVHDHHTYPFDNRIESPEKLLFNEVRKPECLAIGAEHNQAPGRIARERRRQKASHPIGCGAQGRITAKPDRHGDVTSFWDIPDATKGLSDCLEELPP